MRVNAAVENINNQLQKVAAVLTAFYEFKSQIRTTKHYQTEKTNYIVNKADGRRPCLCFPNQNLNRAIFECVNIGFHNSHNIRFIYVVSVANDDSIEIEIAINEIRFASPSSVRA